MKDFRKADSDKDGKLTLEEFVLYALGTVRFRVRVRARVWVKVGFRIRARVRVKVRARLSGSVTADEC